MVTGHFQQEKLCVVVKLLVSSPIFGSVVALARTFMVSEVLFSLRAFTDKDIQ